MSVKKLNIDIKQTAATMPEFSFAFQPIVDAARREIISYEALVRGRHAEPAWRILQSVPPGEMYRFDEVCRLEAIKLAARLNLNVKLNLNFLPRSLLESEKALENTVAIAEQCGLNAKRIVIEVTEGEVIDNLMLFVQILNAHRRTGLCLAIDDFGSGYSGLNLLADFQPDIVKLDMNLVRGINGLGPRQAIVRAVAQACLDLGIDIIAEGVETLEEYRWFMDEGINLFQGYLFARPSFEALTEANFP